MLVAQELKGRRPGCILWSITEMMLGPNLPLHQLFLYPGASAQLGRIGVLTRPELGSPQWQRR